MQSPFTSPGRVATIALAGVLSAFGAVTASAQPTILPMLSPAPERFMGRGNFIFSAGVRMFTGVDIQFSGTTPLGNAGTPLPPLEGGAVFRGYNDGFVGLDAEGNAGNLTRTWRYETADQVPKLADNTTPQGTINFHSYSAAGGAQSAGTSDADGLGMDLQVGRLFFPKSPNFAFGLIGGATFAGIDKSGTIDVLADLITVTDTFSLNGITPPAPPYTSTTGTDGSPAPAIGTVILNRSTTTTAGGADIATNWRVTGGYFNMRVGAVMYMRFGRVLALHVGAGYSVVYASTNFEFTDTFTPPIGESLSSSGRNTAEKWLDGYYAEASMQFWLSNTTGLFLGASMQKNDAYSHSADTHTVRLDFSKTTSITMGVNFRF